MAHSKLIEDLESGRTRIVRLTDTHSIKQFDCGIDDLNDFLFSDAKIYLQYLYATTYLLESNDRTIAYYSLQNDLLQIDPHIDRDFYSEISETIPDKDYSFLLGMKDISTYPAVKIGRFAVDTEFQRCGYGTQILNFIIMSFLSGNKTGCQFITVDALNNLDTLRFYERNGFSYVTLFDCNKPSRQMYKNLISLKQLEYL
ncbi:MAG: GNAT family N-acetyltransferase [Bacteroidales bacterium]|jgi:GNAT superfamily N-acetyltransferase|nr:GNAT family N-acetyltransferase [Bacteroidales bacterium]